LIDDEETPMRWIYLAVIILFAAATIIFALQNFEIVTITFLGFNVGYRRLPPGRGDRRQPVRAAASIVRRVETKHGGFILNEVSLHPDR
jgi:hypothetical protein